MFFIICLFFNFYFTFQTWHLIFTTLRFKFGGILAPIGVKFEPILCEICQGIQWCNWIVDWNLKSLLKLLISTLIFVFGSKLTPNGVKFEPNLCEIFLGVN